MTIGELAREVRLSPGAATALVDRLERAGIARRQAGGRSAQRAAAATVPAVGGGRAATVAAEDAPDADAEEPAEPADQPDDATGSGGDEVTVPAAQSSGTGSPAARRGPDGTRSVSRQQPRRGGSAQRRPGAKKKRR